MSKLVFQAESANPDVNVIAVNDPFMLLDDMVYNSSTTVSTSRCLRMIARLLQGLPREGSSCHGLGSHWFWSRLRVD